MYAPLMGITSILALENDTVPKSLEKTIFLLANLSISQLCLPLSIGVLSGLLVCILFSAGVVQYVKVYT